jgi:hypothetical protein
MPKIVDSRIPATEGSIIVRAIDRLTGRQLKMIKIPFFCVEHILNSINSINFNYIETHLNIPTNISYYHNYQNGGIPFNLIINETMEIVLEVTD